MTYINVVISLAHESRLNTLLAGVNTSQCLERLVSGGEIGRPPRNVPIKEMKREAGHPLSPIFRWA